MPSNVWRSWKRWAWDAQNITDCRWLQCKKLSLPEIGLLFVFICALPWYYLTIIGDLYWTGRRKRTKQQQFDLILGRLQKLMQQRVSRGWKSRRENCSEAPRTSQWHIWWQGQVHLYHSGGESHSMSQHVTTCHNVACHNLSQKDTISKSIGITCLAVLWAEPAEPFLSSVGNGWNMMEPVSLCFSLFLSRSQFVSTFRSRLSDP